VMIVALVAIIILFLIVTFVLDKFTRVRGTIRILHIFEPWGFTVKEILDLTNKTFIVTGANSGLGFGTAQILAEHGADVIMACRSVKKGENAKSQMGQVKGSLTVMELDNSSLLSVKRFANAFKAMNRPLNGLILNAGIMFPPFELTKDGIESQFGVNHVAHFALVKDLLPLMEKNSEQSTIVAVSSLAHWFAPKGVGVHLDLAKINDEKIYNAHEWYGQSKLANLLFARELARRLSPNSNIYVNAVHPGGVQGNLTRFVVGQSIVMKVVDFSLQKLFYWNQRDGALTTLAPAVSPRIIKENIRGKYFVPIGRLDSGSKLSNDLDLAKKVWEFTEDILKQKGWENL